MVKKIFLLAAMGLSSLPAISQIKVGNGQISGSLESNNIYYFKDDGLDLDTPADRFGSNDYLKVDYSIGKFSAGILAEGYMPALQGIDPNYKGIGLTSKYVQLQDKNFSFLVGDVYDQFGSGIVFRSFEDRALGFNNSLEGVRASYNFGNYVSVKGMYGRPRLYMDHADSWVRGVDLSISLSEIVGWHNGLISLEGSYVNRFESLDKEESTDTPTTDETDPPLLMPSSPSLDMYSARLNFDYKGVSFKFEYAAKGDDVSNFADRKIKKGNTILGEIGYSDKGFGIMASFRRMEYMNTLLSLNGGAGLGNVINYLPALTRQYTYLLTNLYPYIANTDGEIGGQIDAYYNLRNKTTRSKYWNFHVNYSNYYSLEKVTGQNSEMLWRDINVDVERQWDKSFKTSLLFSRQQYNTDKGFSDNINTSNTVVADITYKFNKKHSIRAELQYSCIEGEEPDWVAALVEYNISPAWSFYGSDMYNGGDQDLHYYNVGTSYTKSRTRVQLSYGRNREGYICSGGVCRLTPAYTGFSLMLTTSF
ncbi:MAG: DUF6029 family protein [Rikenellaceae bacterium]